MISVINEGNDDFTNYNAGRPNAEKCTSWFLAGTFLFSLQTLLLYDVSFSVLSQGGQRDAGNFDIAVYSGTARFSLR